MPDPRIRFPEASDSEALFEAVRESLPELVGRVPWCHAGYSLADSARFISSRAAARAAGEAYDFVIVGDQGRLLGVCGVNAVNREHRFANLGYWVRTSARGRGVAVQAVGLLSRWVFEHTDLARLEIVVAVGNSASRRVAEKAGAHHEGTLRARLRVRGATHDAHLYSLVRPQHGDGSAGAE